MNYLYYDVSISLTQTLVLTGLISFFPVKVAHEQAEYEEHGGKHDEHDGEVEFPFLGRLNVLEQGIHGVLFKLNAVNPFTEWDVAFVILREVERV